MKKLVLVNLILFLSVMTHLVIAQNVPTDFQEHGKNSSGTTTATENIDSVTVGSTMNYFVMPDLDVNQDVDGPYDYNTNKDALTSTFDWFTVPGLTITPIEANYVNVDFPSTGDYTLNVSEQSDAGCNTDTTTIDVRVINEPEAGFNHATYAESMCFAVPTDATYNFPVSLTTDVADGNIAIHVEIVNTTTSTTVYDGDMSLSDSDTFFTFDAFTEFGTHELTITSVSDRISLKSSVNGTITTGAEVFTFTITKTPSTGTIYHLPNN